MATAGVDARFFEPGVQVWVLNPYSTENDSYRSQWLAKELCGRPVYVPAEVLKGADVEGNLIVRTSLEPSLELQLPVKQVFPMNHEDSLDDLADLAHLHEAEVLYALKKRYLESQPYTRAGSLLLVLNPFQHVMDTNGVSIYHPTYMHSYAQECQGDGMFSNKGTSKALPPHVFEVAAKAHSALVTELQDQAILTLGDAGSGKTESMKIMLQYLVNAGARGDPLAARHPGFRVFNVDTAQKMSAGRSGPLGTARNPFFCEDPESVSGLPPLSLESPVVPSSLIPLRSCCHCSLNKKSLTLCPSSRPSRMPPLQAPAMLGRWASHATTTAELGALFNCTTMMRAFSLAQSLTCCG